MEKLDCMFVHGSKLYDSNFILTCLSDDLCYFTMVSDKVILYNRDALVADLQQTIAAQT